MAITIHEKSSKIIDPEELLDWAASNVDPRDEQGMVACAAKLRALANNRQFIKKALCDELTLVAAGKSGKQLSPQSYIHGIRKVPGRLFTVRSVIWTPALTSNPRSQTLQDRIFSYVTPHDHNFSLLSVGYLGSGYETAIYEYDSEAVCGYAGEDVNITYLETTTLDEGKILYYRPRKDIHIQRHPAEISISLNLIGETLRYDTIPQFEFDIANGKIVGLLTANIVKKQILPFEIVELVGADDKLLNVIIQIAESHESEHIRSAAYRSLAAVRPSQTEALLRSGERDRHPLVRREVQALLY